MSNCTSLRDNVGIILGEPSGWLVDVDLDCPEAIELADQFLPPTPAITGRPSAPRSHRWYIAVGAVTEKHSALDGSMIVELRSTGTQTVVGPSVHPAGETYETLDGEPGTVPAPMLAACVKALADAVIVKRGVNSQRAKSVSNPIQTGCIRQEDFEIRAIAYLNAMPPAISGGGGHNQTFAAATSLVHGFGLSINAAFQILVDHYNPRCQPEWSEQELRHKVEEAAKRPHNRPFGWLRDTTPNQASNDVDLSCFMVKPRSDPVSAKQEQIKSTITNDPGVLPERLFDVPGFVRRVMDFTLANAPYPNVGLAFCGAMALQSFLAGRKVCTTGDLRTNVYLLALAGSGTGKEFPRKVNSQVLFQIGESKSLGDKFTSLRNYHGISILCPEEKQKNGWMTLSEAADHLGISAKTLRIAVEAGKISACHPLPDGPWVLSRSDLDTDQARVVCD
jgi:Bifunctional DNA primase/polymerase, N-terminal